MEERITAVIKTRKHTFMTVFMASLLVAVTAMVFATSARAAVKPETEELLTLEKEDMVKRQEALAQDLSDEKLAIYISEDQIGFEHIDEAEYDILLNDRNISGITVDASLLEYDGTDNKYLQEMITNRTEKTISRVEYCVLAYGEDGSPLRLRWNFLDSSEPESYEYLTWSGGSILPGDTRSLPGGWSIYDSESTYGLEPPAEEYKVEYVLMGIRQIEFGDGSTWLNPDFEGWLAVHKGKETDPEILKGYYPFDCVIFPERRLLDD